VCKAIYFSVSLRAQSAKKADLVKLLVLDLFRSSELEKRSCVLIVSLRAQRAENTNK
jgi:hypothetical protein